MLGGWTVALVALAYIGGLFAIAYCGDKWELRRISPRSRSIIYALTLAVYCTSWTFFGSVGVAAISGFDFLPIYIGPILLLVFGWPVIRHIAHIAKSLNITSIADFLAARYGKSQRLAAVVTVIAVIGIVPYIALQLKAVSESVTVLIGPAAAEALPIGDIAFVVAMAMAVFTVLFGTRHIDATEHQEGLMLAIAAESLVKLVAFLTVGGFITFGMLGGLEGLSTILSENLEVNALFTRTPDAPLWLTQILLATSAVILLPRQFHVAVVENVNERDIRRAAWMFPLYLVAINIFVVPIAIAGMTLLPAGANADMFMLAVPLSADKPLLAMLAFIGGLSAATAMVIVATVALSIMICNDLAVPMMLRRQLGMSERTDMGRLLLYIRRVAIFGVLLLSYAYFRAISSGFALASIGLLSFAAIAQFAPAFFGGMLWRRATERGAMAGILAGFFVWAYTLLLPSLEATGWLPTGLLEQGPWGLTFLRPQALFGIDATPLTHGVGWSLFVNIAAYALVSLTTSQSAVERMQAGLFTRDGLSLSGPGFWHSRAGTGVTVGELAETAARYLGPERARRSFAEFETSGHGSIAPGAEAGLPLVRYTERLLASAVGTASARLVMALLLERQDLAARGALKLLDEASEAIQYNRDLLQSAINHVDQGIGVFDDQMRLV
ncbi:MAG: sodium:solute symporter family protein, partial [Halocynthiibacter sp.]